MNKRSLRVLEFGKILSMLTEYAASPMAKRRCERMKPQKDINIIRTLQQETRDALIRLQMHGSLSFAGLTDIGPSVKRLQVGGVLTSKELLDIASVLSVAENAKKYGDSSDLTAALTSKNKGTSHDSEGRVTAVADTGEKKLIDSLTERFDGLVSLTHISSEIRRCILAENEFADDASPALKKIRRDIRLTNDKLHEQLSKLIKDDATKDMLQDSLITMRNGRYCIPVKQEHRSHFPGMIHDRSQTGSTLFIEPMSIVTLNNEIKELEGAELLEIENILENLSNMAAVAADDISYNTTLLTELDFIFAKAKFARSMNATEPIFNTEKIIDIKNGRHPLLDKHTVVPVDIKLGDDFTLLIVTGPNTGGKTVSLKTLGLFTLMGQAGLHIPTMEGSRLAVFDNVFADIGDEQSIEQSLSTFSSHMSNIVYIVNHATPDSLCLFDELGGGTDPVEGAALAIAILSHLKNMGAICMATTHYSELKTFAISTDGVENASCEFDVASLMPTYRLMIGIPGKSNAFAISKKLGLADDIIAHARKQLDSDSVDMEKLIAELEKDKLAISTDKEQIEKYKKEIEELKQSLAKKEENLETKRAEILQKARSEARELIDEAKEIADKAISDYNKWRSNPGRADMKKMEEKRGELRARQKVLESSKTEGAPKQSGGHSPKDFHIGDRVHVLSMNAKGTVSTLPDQKGNLMVQMGILSSRVHISDLLIINEPAFTTDAEGYRQKRPALGGKTHSTGRTSLNKAMTFSPELNVMGMTVDEAIMEIDKFLDDACLSHIEKVTIIHGKGTGALRNGIHQYLKKLKYVKSFRAGEYGEGEYGVTIVEL